MALKKSTCFRIKIRFFKCIHYYSHSTNCGKLFPKYQKAQPTQINYSQNANVNGK